MLLIDIDGLRPDVLERAVRGGKTPHLARLLGGSDLTRGLLYPLLAPAPSITFASQACLFTGAHPKQHGIPGNQFFDRFGSVSEGRPRHYAFDVGDTLAADDAVLVFSAGLASQCLRVPTLYELLNQKGLRSAVMGHMYARGAQDWRPPSLLSLARFTRGGNLFGLSAAEFDRQNLERALDYLHENGLPDVLTVYFMGVDHESHHHGPGAQEAYLTGVLDDCIGELWEAILSLPGLTTPPPVAIFSDHGQIGVPDDDRHSLRLAFPFEREMEPIFSALGWDVLDFPGEDPTSDAVAALNGGLALIYLMNRGEGARRWDQPPDFERDVLPLGRAFWESHATGQHTRDLYGALAGVLMRDVQFAGWSAPYQALTPTGALISLPEWFAQQPPELYADPLHRLDNLCSPLSGDLLLISNAAEGFYFAHPLKGVHGGLGPQESWASLALGWPESEQEEWDGVKSAFKRAIARRCQDEGGRLPSTADLLTGLFATQWNV